MSLPRLLRPLLAALAAALPGLGGLALAGFASAGKANVASSLVSKVLSFMGAEWTEDDRINLIALLNKAADASKDETCGRGSGDFAHLFVMSHSGSAADWEEVKLLEWNIIFDAIDSSLRVTRSEIITKEGEIEKKTQEIEEAEQKTGEEEASGGNDRKRDLIDDEAGAKKFIIDSISSLDDEDLEDPERVADVIKNKLDEEKKTIDRKTFESVFAEACDEANVHATLSETLISEVPDIMKSHFDEMEEPSPEEKRRLSISSLRKAKESLENETRRLKEDEGQCLKKRGAVKAFEEHMLSLTMEQNTSLLNFRKASASLTITQEQLVFVNKTQKEQQENYDKLMEALEKDGANKDALGRKLEEVREKTQTLTVEFERISIKLKSLGEAFVRASRAAMAANKFKENLTLFIKSMLALYKKTVHTPIKAVLKHLTREPAEIPFQDPRGVEAFNSSSDLLVKLRSFCNEDETITAFHRVDFLNLCNHTPAFLCEADVIQAPQDNIDNLRQVLISRTQRVRETIARLRMYLLPEEEDYDGTNEVIGIYEFMLVFARLEFAQSYIRLWLESEEDCEGESRDPTVPGSFLQVDQNTPGALLKVWRRLNLWSETLERHETETTVEFQKLEVTVKETSEVQEGVEKDFNEAVSKFAKTDEEKDEYERLLKESEEKRLQLTKETATLRTNWFVLKDKLEQSQRDIVESHKTIKKTKEAAAAGLAEIHSVKEAAATGLVEIHSVKDGIRELPSTAD